MPTKVQEFRDQLGRRLRQYRELAGLSRSQVAQAAFLRPDEVKQFEEGTRPIPADVLVMLSNAVGVRSSFLLGDHT